VLAVHEYIVSIQHGPTSPRFHKLSTKLQSVLLMH
jgi:hypothetical protein